MFEAIAVIFLPQMLGARDLPLPDSPLLAIGAFFLEASSFAARSFPTLHRVALIHVSAIDFSYQPGIGATSGSGIFIHRDCSYRSGRRVDRRNPEVPAPGMRINLIPPYCWYVLVAAAMVVFRVSSLIAGSMLLEIERAFHWPFFDAQRGGDALLYQHLFWLFGHPEVYIIFLPCRSH